MRGMLITAALALVLIGATLPAVVRQFYPPLPAKEPGARPGAVVVLGAGRPRAGPDSRPNPPGPRRLPARLRDARPRELHILPTGTRQAHHPPRPGDADTRNS